MDIVSAQRLWFIRNSPQNCGLDCWSGVSPPPFLSTICLHSLALAYSPPQLQPNIIDATKLANNIGAIQSYWMRKTKTYMDLVMYKWMHWNGGEQVT